MCVCVLMCMDSCVCVTMYMHVCLHVYTYMFIYVHTFVRVHSCADACTHDACTHDACTHVPVHVCMQIHIPEIVDGVLRLFVFPLCK